MRKTLQFAALAAILVTGACTRESGEEGRTIVFRTSTEYDNGPDTRTDYSGVIYGGKERIDWVTGDTFRIYSDVARCEDGTTPFSDYYVTGVTPGTGALLHKSFADVSVVDSDRSLQWGSGTHNFYCVYPSPAHNSNVAYTSANAVSFTLPATQGYTLQSDGVTLKPDMDYAYMYAAVQTGSSSMVNLSFKPLFTAFQFTVDSRDDASMTITSFTLSSASKALTGSCTATMTAQTASESSTVAYSNFPAATDANKVITVSFNGGSGFTVTKTNPFTFTVFALPQSYTDLSASFTTSAGETKTISLTPAGSGFTAYQPGYKYDLTHLALPGEWTYGTAAPIADIELVNDDYMEPFPIVSVSRTRDGVTENNLPWKLYFSPTEPAVGDPVASSWSETPLKDNANQEWVEIVTADAAWLDAYVRGIALAKYNVTEGDNSFQVVYNYLYNQNSSLLGQKLLSVQEPEYAIRADLNPGTSSMISDLQSNNLGTVDLSTMALDAEATAFTPGHPATTANCYVINGYGSFLIPLVYGNGVKNGEITASYKNGPLDNPSFYNASGDVITSDYIMSDTNLRTTGPYDGVVVWQDVLKGFEFIENVEYCPSAPSGAVLSCPYLKFSIPRDRIKPGNAVVALRDKGTGMMIWSWHIWVTAENLSTRNAFYSSTASLSYLSCNLGWTPPITYDNGTDREQYVVVVCETNNKVVDAFKISQIYDSTSRLGGGTYSSAYYQWGRKDPLLPSNGSSRDKPYTMPNDVNFVFDLLPVVSSIEPSMIANLIKFPASYAYSNYTDVTLKSAKYWNAKVSPDDGNDYQVTKTIYDPSPAGFAVPRRSAYNAFSHDGMIYGSWSNTFGEMPAGYNLTSGAWGSTSPYNLFFPALGVRDASNEMNITLSYSAYWSAAVDYGNKKGYGFNFTQDNITQPSTNSLQNLLPVRPVREEE